MSRRNKRVVASSGGDAKQVRAPAASAITQSPLWAFRCADIGGPWCWSKLNGSKLIHVIEHLRAFESMTWANIEGSSHFVKVATFCRRAQKRLAEINQDDIDELFSLRLSGKERIWGIRHGHVLRLLWWDPLHEVCPSHLKHT